MALSIDKDGKIIEKHLTASIDEIKQALKNNPKKDIQREILARAVKTKIHGVQAS